MENISILIVGGGISGLALAYFLQVKGFDCKVLEKDDNINGKRQGFSLTLQGATRDILLEYKLLDEFYKYGSIVKTQLFLDHKGNELQRNDDNEKRFNYPLPRQKIREIFFSKLKENTVLWGKSVNKICDFIDHKVITCSDESEYKCKLLIACDGLNSKIRTHYLGDSFKLNDLQLMNIYGIVELDRLDSKDKKFFINTEVQLLDGIHRFFSKPFNDCYQMWELTYPLHKTDAISLKFYEREDPRSDALNKAISIAKEWQPPTLYEFLKATQIENVIIHPLYDHIPFLSDLRQIPENVVLIGDSIHPMSPYIGRGANEAIIDSYEFASLLNNNNDLLDPTINTIISKYKEQIVNRTRRSVERSRENTIFYHTSDAINKEKLREFKNWT